MMQSRKLVRGVFLSRQRFSLPFAAHQVSSNVKEKIVASIEEANDTSDSFRTFSGKFGSSTPFSKVSEIFQILKEAKLTHFVKKGYDVMKDELYGKPSPRKHLEYTPPPSFKSETNPRKDIGVLPLNDTIFEETDSAMAIKEITRRDPSFSLMDFVAEVQEIVRPVLDAYIKKDIETLKKYCTLEFVARCEAEHKAFHSRGTFLDNKILYINEVILKETKMMGTSPIIVISFRTQELHCVLDRNGAITEGDKDTIHYMYNEWAMQRIDPEELGEGAIYPIWKLRETQQDPYLPE